MKDVYIDELIAGKLVGEIGSEIFVQISDLFISEATNCLAEILAAYDVKDHLGVAEKSHSIRSAGASVGCSQLSNNLKQIELTARDERWQELEPLIAALPDLLRNSVAALTDYAATGLD